MAPEHRPLETKGDSRLETMIFSVTSGSMLVFGAVLSVILGGCASSSSPSGAGAHLYADSPGQPLQRCECQGGRVNDPQWNGDPTLPWKIIGMEMDPTLQEFLPLPEILKLNRSWHLKMDGWNTFSFPFGALGPGLVSGPLAVSFMEENHRLLKCRETGSGIWDGRYLEAIVLVFT